MRVLWIGAYWKEGEGGSTWQVYVCLVPMLPLRLTVWRFW